MATINQLVQEFEKVCGPAAHIDALQDDLNSRLAAKPETGAQWAAICALENEIISLKRGV